MREYYNRSEYPFPYGAEDRMVWDSENGIFVSLSAAMEEQKRKRRTKRLVANLGGVQKDVIAALDAGMVPDVFYTTLINGMFTPFFRLEDEDIFDVRVLQVLSMRDIPSWAIIARAIYGEHDWEVLYMIRSEDDGLKVYYPY